MIVLVLLSGQLVTSSKTAVPTVAEQAAAMQLGNAAKNLQTALAELRSAAGKAQASINFMAWQLHFSN